MHQWLTTGTRGVILIRNGRVYDQAATFTCPRSRSADVDGIIAAVRPGIASAIERREGRAELGARAVDQQSDATDKLVMPGFVNAHYHSARRTAQGLASRPSRSNCGVERTAAEFSEAQPLPNPRPHVAWRGLMLCAAEVTTVTGPVHDPIRSTKSTSEAIPSRPTKDIGIRCVFARNSRHGCCKKSNPFWEDVVPPEQRAALAARSNPSRDRSARLLRDIVVSSVIEARG